MKAVPDVEGRSVAAREAQKISHGRAAKLRPFRPWIATGIDILCNRVAIGVNVVAIQIRDMIFVFLNDAIPARRCFETLATGRDV